MDEACDANQIISEVVLKLERTGAHSHIHGLGLDDTLKPKEVCQRVFSNLTSGNPIANTLPFVYF
mgnify:CR=1 FL=1